MTTITLKPITAANWQACIALTVTPDQAGFVPSNLYSIAEAQFYPEARSRALVSDEGELVGYGLFGRDVVSGKWKIFRVMIDAQYQSQGYGSASVAAIINEIAQEPDGDQILICYKVNNDVARRLYAQFGFEEISTEESGKVTALRDCSTNGNAGQLKNGC